MRSPGWRRQENKKSKKGVEVARKRKSARQRSRGPERS